MHILWAFGFPDMSSSVEKVFNVSYTRCRQVRHRFKSKILFAQQPGLRCKMGFHSPPKESLDSWCCLSIAHVLHQWAISSRGPRFSAGVIKDPQEPGKGRGCPGNPQQAGVGS